jgi:hypothetical protein
MKIKIDELTPGEPDVWEARVKEKRRALESGGELPAIDVVKISGRTHVRNGAHRVRATIEHCQANGLPLEIECVEVSAVSVHHEYPAVCDKIYKDFGSGIDAFKKIPYR